MKITGENISHTATSVIEFISITLELHNKFLLSDRKQSLLVERDDGVHLHILVGYMEGISIEYMDNNDRKLPYYMTYNKEKRVLKKKTVIFFYFGHYSEIDAYHLINLGKVVNILSVFFEYKTIDFYNGDWIEEK